MFERTGHLYRKYRARVAELKKSFDETKTEVKDEPGSSINTVAPAAGRLREKTEGRGKGGFLEKLKIEKLNFAE